MKNKWKSIRLGAMLFALPVVATAAASANQWMIENTPIEISTEIADTFDSISALRNHTISLNDSGNVEGRIASIEADSKANGLSGLQVFMIRDGEVAHETKTDSDGLFSLESVEAGVYSFVATGQSGFAAYGVRVVDGSVGSSLNLIEAAAVSPKTSVVKQLLGGELPVKVATAVLENATVSEVASNVVGSNKVMIKDGTLLGHVIPMLGEVSAANGTSVYIIKDNQQVAEALTDASGSFSVQDLEPGVYDFVAAGPTGFAAVSFEAVDSKQAELAAAAADTDEIPVALVSYQDIATDLSVDGAAGSLDVCTTCQADAGVVSDQITYQDNAVYSDAAPIEYAGETVGSGCAAGGSCGSAGNFSSFNSCSSCNACSACGGGRRGLLGGRGGLLGGRSGGGRLFGGGRGGLFGGGRGALLGGRFARLALLGGVAAAISIDDDDSSPDSVSN